MAKALPTFGFLTTKLVRFRLIALWLLVFTTTAARAEVNLIINGGFETGTFSGWTVSDLSLTTASPHNPHSGSFAAKLGNRSASTLDQIIPTVSGTAYTIDLFIGRLGLLASGSNFSLSASFAGTDFLNFDALTLPLNSPYAEYTATVQASSSSSLLRFAYVDQPSYILIDDVSVTTLAAVPEPATTVLLIIGLVSICAWRRPMINVRVG